jgi:hypothetical protein
MNARGQAEACPTETAINGANAPSSFAGHGMPCPTENLTTPSLASQASRITFHVTCGTGDIFMSRLPADLRYQNKGTTMALTFSLIDTWDDGKRIHVTGTIAASGNYATGGDALDLSQSPVVASAQPPINGTAWMDGLAGYDYVFMPGAAMNSNKVKIFQQGAAAGAFPELAAGAYPGAITADSITFYGIFKKLQ